MKRLNRTAWLNQGFKILKTSGAAGLTIENLASNLNKTKGSFYHHFKSRNDYFEKLLEEWENRQTLQVIQLSKKEKSFENISKKLFLLSEKKYEPEVEVAIRAWALRDPLARSFQERIDTQRVGFLKEMFTHITDDTEKTEIMSLIRYCFYIGSQQIIPPIDKDTYKILLDTLTDVFEVYVTKE